MGFLIQLLANESWIRLWYDRLVSLMEMPRCRAIRHGTPYNGANSQALTLDGINDYVDVGDFEIGGGVTFSVWVT